MENVFSDDLKKFLIDEGVYEIALDYTIMEHANLGSPEITACDIRSLDAGFVFKETKEGITYWYDLKHKFDRLKQLKVTKGI